MLRLIDRVSLAGDPPVNDDADGAIGSPAAGAAWVIDGATGIAEQGYVPGAAGDAAWFADTLNRAMTRQAMLGGALEQQMRQAYLAANAGFAAVAGTAVPDYARPIATLMVVAWSSAEDGRVRLDYVSLGDGSALVIAKDLATLRLGSPEAASDAPVNAAVKQLQAGGTTDPDAVRQALTGRLRQSRARAVGRYAAWAAGASQGAARLERQRLELTPPGLLLLATDGFYRLIDTYRAYSPDSLIKAAGLGGLAELGQELRRIEAADPICLSYPRLKPRDDATAVLIAIDPPEAAGLPRTAP
jgi:hypothetical protein